MYRHLRPLINLLICFPIKGIRDQAYTLARAAMLSTGAFDSDPREIDAWFMFLPGCRREDSPAEDQGLKVSEDLFEGVVLFLCNAVSSVGTNLYKYHNTVRCQLSKLNDFGNVKPDFSPFVSCILDKCIRLLGSDSKKKLCEKSMISIYVCNTLCFLLQTQVQGGLLPGFIDIMLTARLDNLSLGGGGRSRTVIDAVRVSNYHKFSMAWLPPTAQWRTLRKLTNSHIFTTQKLDSNQSRRQQKLEELVSYVRRSANAGTAVDIGQAVFTTVLNLISNIFFSIDLANDFGSAPVCAFKDAVRGVMLEAGRPNLSDYFPLIRFMDLQGVRRGMSKHFGVLDEIFEKIIEKKLLSLPSRGGKGDLLDMILDPSHENGIRFNVMKSKLYLRLVLYYTIFCLCVNRAE
ncbi:hypothetical protein MKW98_006526 [Papaver atlanticum]|uniref:Cytochrome P450 n=1 Tax=Papaver atlanticum TaxID=357466 RepID=A0AAD4T963_9MAGN|nr:hypothetical protein MKW98_006526 [Papaver atlanticum]